jgi:sulfopyruvate decarboxylase subunit alpha
LPSGPSASLIVGELRRQGATHVVGLPDNASKALFERLQAEATMRVFTVTREGEAFAVAAGLWAGGGAPVVLIQNTGLLESGDALRGTAMRMRIPLVCMVTYRGYAGLASGRGAGDVDANALSRPDLDSVAVLTEPTLRAWGLPFDFLHGDLDLPRLAAAFAQARGLEQPVALLITRDTC